MKKRNNNKNQKKPFIKLTFELTAKDPSETLSSKPSTVNIIVKMVQRALVFQGGGSLGAYEAGVFKALCEVLVEQDNKIEAKKNRPLFDVIAGSSIGAVNAAIIVGSIKKRLKDNKDNNDKDSLSSNTVTSTISALKQQSKLIWKDVANELDRFWNEISRSTWWLDNDFFNIWWNSWNKITKTNIQRFKSILDE